MRKVIYIHMKSGQVVKVKATSWEFGWDGAGNLMRYKFNGMRKGNHLAFLNVNEVEAVTIR